MNAQYQGSCLCGKARFQIEGSFDSLYLCHCSHCQKDTGSAHAANLFSGTAKLIWLSGEDGVTSFTLPGTRHGKSFCRHCGSALPNMQPGPMLVVPAGSLDTPIDIQPSAKLFCASRADWVTAATKATEFAGLPE